MVDIVERARSPEFADVAEKYLLAECAAEIERLRAEVAEAKAGHAHLMESYQALGRECYQKLGAAERAGLERAAEIIKDYEHTETPLRLIRAELTRPARKEE